VRAWLFTIARNKAIDEERRAARRPQPEGEVDSWPGEEAADHFEDPVWDEVRALPEKQRVAVTLRFRGDLTHREIGEVMETSEAAARRNVFEGVKTLRERTGDE
jgi:RNA polymerase sigma factor (sigma-70 family)